jgi:paraquat-inducible protein A
MLRTLRPLLLLSGAVSFGLGISLPLIAFKKFFLLSETPSLIGVVAGLWDKGDFLLCGVIALFSIVFPLVKMFTVYEAAFGAGRFPAWAGVLSKWSMMDVLLVALVVFAAKTSGLAAAVSQPGVWFYALSTLLVAAASAGMKAGE